jgi:uncharacterized protein YndB with AHSA1/START domain
MTPPAAPADGPADRAMISTRVFPAPPAAVFAAFADPARLARWWGPNGFTNTIHAFDFRPGGHWRLTMHGPDGANYANESVFTAITPVARIVFKHLEPVHGFEMTMTFSPEAGGTALTWRMLFDSAAEADRVRAFVLPANEQNFDRLAAHLRAST